MIDPIMEDVAFVIVQAVQLPNVSRSCHITEFMDE